LVETQVIGKRVTFDPQTTTVCISNLSVKDPDVFEVISNLDELERPEFVKRALKVGTIALRDVLVTEKVDFVKKEFDSLCVRLDNMLRQELGKEGMKGELEKVFGEKGELQNSLQKLFGSDGNLSRDILDMNNTKSPIGQLRSTIESYFVGKDSEIYGMLDPNSKDSPIARLRTEIIQKLDTIERDIETYLAKKEVVENTTKKGFVFEEALEETLLRLSKPYGDCVERTGTERGKLGNQKGDFVITVHDCSIKGKAPKIVVEAKTDKSVRLTTKSLLGELRDALQNRDACFAIAITDRIISEGVGCYHEMEGDKIICAFEENTLPVEVAYKIARTYVLIKSRDQPDKGIDMQAITGVISKITGDLGSIRTIKTKLTSINNAADSIEDEVSTLEKNIRSSLLDLQNSLKT
jgi:hypothetical protein